MIEVKDLHKSFGRKHVLRGVSLTVEKGQSTVIIGGSGSGKSVFLKHILGLMRPNAGSIKINGVETTTLSRRQRADIDARMGMLFQKGALFDSLAVWQNVAFVDIQCRGCSEEEARAIATEALARVELKDDILDHYPASLTGGMHKRIGLARAIAHKPEIIFFDEPTTGLDPIMTDVINHLIVETVKDLGATTLTITHDMTSVRAIADKAAFLYEGQFIWQGDNQELDASDNPYLRQFVAGLPEGPIRVEGATS